VVDPLERQVGLEAARNSSWLNAPSSSRPLEVMFWATWARMSSPISSVASSIWRLPAAAQHFQAHLVVRRLDFDGDAALQPRTHPRIERFQLPWRPVGGDHDLAGGIEQHVEQMAELVLDRLALQELHVVDDQQIDVAQRFLERQRVIVADRAWRSAT
jgi:hypothetical protein